MSALPLKADMREPARYVRFVPKADKRTAAKKHRYSITSSANGLEVDDKLELCRLYQWQVHTLKILEGATSRKALDCRMGRVPLRGRTGASDQAAAGSGFTTTHAEARANP